MKERVIIGIDPGVTGAIGILDSRTGNCLDVLDVPIVKIKRKELLLPVYYDTLKHFNIVGASIEKVNSAATGSIMTAFTFGGTFIAPQCFMIALGVEFQLVTPQAWKKTFSLLGTDKEASRKLTLELYPSMINHLKYKKDHNRADAILIARYYWLKYKNVLRDPVSRVSLKNG